MTDSRILRPFSLLDWLTSEHVGMEIVFARGTQLFVGKYYGRTSRYSQQLSIHQGVLLETDTGISHPKRIMSQVEEQRTTRDVHTGDYAPDVLGPDTQMYLYM